MFSNNRTVSLFPSVILYKRTSNHIKSRPLNIFCHLQDTQQPSVCSCHLLFDSRFSEPKKGQRSTHWGPIILAECVFQSFRRVKHRWELSSVMTDTHHYVCENRNNTLSKHFQHNFIHGWEEQCIKDFTVKIWIKGNLIFKF